jgi:hypothetical protein
MVDGAFGHTVGRVGCLPFSVAEGPGRIIEGLGIEIIGAGKGREGHMIDKREWRRVDVDFEAECSCLNMPKEKFKVRVINLTMNGLCFTAPASVQPCHRMLMAFQIQGEGQVTLEVKTVWSGYFEKPA